MWMAGPEYPAEGVCSAVPSVWNTLPPSAHLPRSPAPVWLSSISLCPD